MRTDNGIRANPHFYTLSTQVRDSGYSTVTIEEQF